MLDVPFSTTHTIVYDFNSPYGESCYRLMTRTGDFIYLRTRGYLDIDRDTNQVRSFVCVNALVEEEEGKKLVREMKKKFTIMIQETEISSNEPDVPTVENPAQLERAIISLITNLHHGPGSSGSIGKMIESPDPQGSSDGHESDTSRSVKSPPLEIIPPKPSSVKTSILNSMDVVNATLKHIQNSGKGKGGDGSSGSCVAGSSNSSDTEDDKSTVKKLSKVVRTSVVQRNANATNFNDHETSSNANSGGSPSKTPTSTVTASTSSGAGGTHHESTSHTFITESITVKQEQPDSIEDSRIPPLPTNAGYFEMSPYNTQQYIEDISSPLECKPFDFLGFDAMQVQQADQSRQYLTPETAAQYQNQEQYNTSSGSSNINNRLTQQHTTNQTSHVSGIKRSCSSEDLNNSNKRRYYDGTQCNTTSNGNNSDGSGCGVGGHQIDEKISLSIHQTCIDHLTDPELGIFCFHLKKNNEKNY